MRWTIFYCMLVVFLMSACSMQNAPIPIATHIEVNTITPETTNISLPSATRTPVSSPTATATGKPTLQPMRIWEDKVDPQYRIVKLNGELKLEKLIGYMIVSNAVGDYTIRIYSDFFDVTYNSLDEIGIVDLTGVAAGLYDVNVEITDKAGRSITKELPHIAIVDKVGFPQDPNFPPTGVNLSAPPQMGFNRTLYQALVYEDNVIGNFALRFGYYPYQDQDYKNLLKDIGNDRPIVLIAPNIVDFSTFHEFITLYPNRFKLVEAGNEPNTFGPTDAKEVYKAIKITYAAVKLVNPSIPVAFPSIAYAQYFQVDPFVMIRDILQYNNGDICNYFDWLAIHIGHIGYSIPWEISQYKEIISTNCGFTPPIVITELYGIKDGTVAQIGSKYFWNMMTAFNDPDVIFAGPHDWEFNEGWVNHTQGIIYAMNRYFSQPPSD